MSEVVQVKELTANEIGKRVRLTVRGATTEGELSEIYCGTKITSGGTDYSYSINIGSARVSGIMVSGAHEIEVLG